MEEMVGRGTGMVSVEIPFTPAAKRVLGDGVPWSLVSRAPESRVRSRLFMEQFCLGGRGQEAECKHN